MAKQPPEPDLTDLIQPDPHLGIKSLKRLPHLRGIALLCPSFHRPIPPFLDRHDVAQRPAAQRIADQMAARPHENLGLFRCARLTRDQRPPGHLAGKERHLPPVQRGANL